MNELAAWRPEYTVLTVALGSLTLGFNCYHFLAQAPFFHRWLARFWPAPDDVLKSQYFAQRTLGFVFFGILPASAVLLCTDYSLADLGVTATLTPVGAIWLVAFSAFMYIINYKESASERNYKKYPMLRVVNWGPKLVWADFFFWALYHAGYEFLFRGLLIFGLAPVIGMWPALFMSILAYSITHLPKGAKETWGAIPLGFLMGLMTVMSGNLVPTFIFHVFLSATNDYRALQANPNMHLEGNSLFARRSSKQFSE